MGEGEEKRTGEKDGVMGQDSGQEAIALNLAREIKCPHYNGNNRD